MPRTPHPTSAETILAIDAAFKRCSAVAADSVLSICPGLDRDSLRRTVEAELWLAITEITEHARNGGVLC